MKKFDKDTFEEHDAAEPNTCCFGIFQRAPQATNKAPEPLEEGLELEI